MMGLITLGVALLMLVAAIPLVAGPPLPRVASWLRSNSIPDSDETLTATRAALQRIGLVSGAVVVVLGVTVLVANMHFYTAFVGYAVAVIAGSCVPLGGSSRRHANLSDSGLPASSPVLPRISIVLSTATVSLGVSLSIVLAKKSEVAPIMLDTYFWMPSIDLRHLAIVTGASLLIAILTLVGISAIKRRQSVAGATSRADLAVRDLCTRRIGLGALGGQLILFAAALPALQILTLNTSADANTQLLIGVTSAAGIGLMIAGILTIASAVLLPIWLQSRHAAKASSSAMENINGQHSPFSARPLARVEQRGKE